MRPGGALPARLVTTGAGLPADRVGTGEDAAAPGDDEDGGELGPGNFAGGGSAGDGFALPAAPRPAPETAPVLPPLHGITEVPGPPSRPTAMTIRQATSAALAPTPTCRIRRRRRPDRSVNTGGPSVTGGFRGLSGRGSDPRWVPAPRARDPVMAADPFGHPGHRAGNSRHPAARQHPDAPGMGEHTGRQGQTSR